MDKNTKNFRELVRNNRLEDLIKCELDFSKELYEVDEKGNTFMHYCAELDLENMADYILKLESEVPQQARKGSKKKLLRSFVIYMY